MTWAHQGTRALQAPTCLTHRELLLTQTQQHGKLPEIPSCLTPSHLGVFLAFCQLFPCPCTSTWWILNVFLWREKTKVYTHSRLTLPPFINTQKNLLWVNSFHRNNIFICPCNSWPNLSLLWSLTLKKQLPVHQEPQMCKRLSGLCEKAISKWVWSVTSAIFHPGNPATAMTGRPEPGANLDPAVELGVKPRSWFKPCL